MNVKRALKSKAAIPAYVLLAAFVGYLGYDLVQTVRKAGIYRRVYAGRVVETRRTFLGYLAITEGCGGFSGSSRERRRNRRRHRRREGSRSSGRYTATISTEDGRLMDVAITRGEYDRIREGQYVISRHGDPTWYEDRAAAFKAVGATKQTAPPPAGR